MSHPKLKALIRNKKYVKPDLSILLDIKNKSIILGHKFCINYGILY